MFNISLILPFSDTDVLFALLISVLVLLALLVSVLVHLALLLSGISGWLLGQYEKRLRKQPKRQAKVALDEPSPAPPRPVCSRCRCVCITRFPKELS